MIGILPYQPSINRNYSYVGNSKVESKDVKVGAVDGRVAHLTFM